METLINSPEFKQLRPLRCGTQFILQDAKHSKFYAAKSVDSPEMVEATTTELCNQPFGSDAYIFLDSCNGVIWGSNYEHKFVFWNPNSNMQHLDLPPCPIRLDKASYYQGFGYDAARDDYKVVILTQFHGSHIYSLKSKSWKKLQECPFYEWGLKTYNGVFTNNALNWIMRRRWPRSGEVIVALDLTTEKYHLVPLPQLEETTLQEKYLHVLDGCLCLMVLKDVYLVQFDMWMMMKYGAKGSWTKLRLQLPGQRFRGFCTRDFSKLKPVIYSRGSGKTFLVFQYHDRCLIWYDIEEGLDHQVVNIKSLNMLRKEMSLIVARAFLY